MMVLPFDRLKSSLGKLFCIMKRPNPWHQSRIGTISSRFHPNCCCMMQQPLFMIITWSTDLIKDLSEVVFTVSSAKPRTKRLLSEAGWKSYCPRQRFKALPVRKLKFKDGTILLRGGSLVNIFYEHSEMVRKMQGMRGGPRRWKYISTKNPFSSDAYAFVLNGFLLSMFFQAASLAAHPLHFPSFYKAWEKFLLLFVKWFGGLA
jgi:hypothetical protein